MKYITIKNSQAIEKRRDDPRVYLPTAFNPLKYGNIKWCKLSKMVETPSATYNASKEPDTVFNYIDLADIDEVDGKVINVQHKLGIEIKGAKVLLNKGDIAFARIEPSIFNKKNALITEEISPCLGSTEIFIARPKEGISSIYIHWALRGEWISDQLNPGILRGSTGRRRLKREDFSNLLIPDISIELQSKIEKIIIEGYKKRDELLIKANNEIEKAKFKSITIIEENNKT